MFNIRVANKEDHAEQITNNNCAMALETENKILDEATAKFGVSRVFDNKELGFYLVAENKGYKPIYINSQINFEVTGLVTSVINQFA